MNLDNLLETSINKISNRLSTVELEFMRIAGSRLAEIGIFSPERAREYLFSTEHRGDVNSDLNKIKKALNQAHRENIKDIGILSNNITSTVYSEGQTLGQERGRNLSPKKEYRTAVNPMLNSVLRNYQIMARSTSINNTYKKTIRQYVNRITGDDRINAPQAMRQAVRELTEQGITTVNYESGRQMRMDSAVRNSLMTEFTHIVQEVQNKVGEEIGADAVEISAHAHAAEDHEPCQGHIFTNEEFEKLQNGDEARDVDIEKYERGDPDYLGETFQTDRPIGMWNCRHVAYNFLLGISEPSFSKDELERLEKQNEKGVNFHGKNYSLYEAEQEQRKLETAMRHEREKLNLLKEVKDVDPALNLDYQRSRDRLAELRNEYKELGAVLEPHAIRTKMERSYAPRVENTISRMATGKVVDNLQHITHIGSVGIPDVNNEVSNGVYNSIKDVYERYPALDGKITSIGQNEHGKNVLASVYEDTGELNLNIEFFGGTAESMKTSYEKWVEEGKFPKGTTWQSAINHEIGHIVDRYITLIERQNPDRGKILRTNFSTELKRTVMKELGIGMKDWDQYIIDGLSIYATESAREFMAEAFSEFTTSRNPRIIARTVGRIIERYLKGEINYGSN